MIQSDKKNTESYLKMYRQMLKIRVFEDNANKLYLSAKMPGLTHMYSGQEAVAVGSIDSLQEKDYIQKHIHINVIKNVLPELLETQDLDQKIDLSM